MADKAYKFVEVSPKQRVKWYRVPSELIPAPAATSPPIAPEAPKSEVNALLEQIQQRLDLVTSPSVLGRLTDGVGPVEDIGLVDLLNALGESVVTTGLTDEDDVSLQDTDGESIADTDSALESPLRPTRMFRTVAEMLASESGSWDTAVTLNWSGTDANAQVWVMLRDSALVDNGSDLLEMDDSFGFARTFTTRGPTSGDNFATIDSVASAISGLRHIHTQSVAANSWNIVHAIGGFPSVTTTNASGKEIKGEVVYVSDTTIAVSFSRPLTGFAYLN